jgi:cytochrome-b5 reductase
LRTHFQIAYLSLSVFDVTKYLHDHPGGADVLEEIAGGDGSEAFDAAGHSEDAFDIKKDLRVGRLIGDAPKRKTRKTVRLIAPTIKEKAGRFSPAIIALSVGLTSSIACGVWWGATRFNTASLPSPGSFATEWAAVVKRRGLGFTEGILLTSAAFTLTIGLAIRRFMATMDFESGTWDMAAHLKIPRKPQPNVLNERGWLAPATFQKLPLVKKELLAANTYRFVFALPSSDAVLGLPIGKHVSIRGMVNGKLVSRSYTPISNNLDRGVLELVVRCYADGVLTNGYMRQLEVGDEVEFRGPKGLISYDRGFCEKIGMVAGGTGITPMYQLIRAICENQRDTTEINLIYANRTVEDILLREELDTFARKYPRNFKIFYVLDKAPKEWQGGQGFVTREMMDERFAEPSPTTKILLCGPPPMVESVKKSLGTLGFKLPGAITKPTDDILCF